MILITISAFLGLSTGLQQPDQHSQMPIMLSNKPKIDVLLGDRLMEESWILSKETNPDIYEVWSFTGQKDKLVCFLSDIDSFCRSIGPEDRYRFIIRYDDHDYVTEFFGKKGFYQFDERYVEAHRGKFDLEIPEIYELINVGLALTPEAYLDKSFIWEDSEYYNRVIDQFQNFRDHPLVSWLSTKMKEDRTNFIKIRSNALTLDFDEKGKVVPTGHHETLYYPNELVTQSELIDDFALQTEFRSFYQKNDSFYKSSSDVLYSFLPVSEASKWLNENFDLSFDYDYTRIVYSPLSIGVQRVNPIRLDHFSEIQIQLEYPHRLPNGRVPDDLAERLYHSRFYFTELNHAYLFFARQEYEDRIKSAIGDVASWSRPDSPAALYYKSPISTFDEMLNWALLDLFYMDLLPEAKAREKITENRREMSEDRGFTYFPEFSRYMIKTYSERAPGMKFSDLYPAILYWFENEGPSKP